MHWKEKKKATKENLDCLKTLVSEIAYNVTQTKMLGIVRVTYIYI